MGEIAEAMLSGEMCEVCGEFFEDCLDGEPGPGHPRTCSGCLQSLIDSEDEVC